MTRRKLLIGAGALVVFFASCGAYKAVTGDCPLQSACKFFHREPATAAAPATTTKTPS